MVSPLFIKPLWHRLRSLSLSTLPLIPLSAPYIHADDAYRVNRFCLSPTYARRGLSTLAVNRREQQVRSSSGHRRTQTHNLRLHPRTATFNVFRTLWVTVYLLFLSVRRDYFFGPAAPVLSDLPPRLKREDETRLFTVNWSYRNRYFTPTPGE